MKRKGYSEETIRAIKRTYMTIFRSKKPREDAITEIEAEFAGIPEVMYLVEFIRTSERGVIG